MSGSVVRALDWDYGTNQRYLTFNREEVSLYETINHGDADHDDVYENDANNNNSDDSGMAKLSTRSGFDSINCMSYAPYNMGITGVGQINGQTIIFDINTPNSNLAKIKPKQSRPVNSISFNSNGVVAIGYDKARQDHCLQLYNVQHYSKNGNNDHITSAPFLSYIPNEVILSASFNQDSGGDPNCLIAGSYKFLREFDLRTDQHVFQLGTRCTSGISFDPFNPYRFASYAEDGTLCIWDRRKLISGVKYFKTSSASGTHINNAGVVHEAPLLTFNKLLNDSRKNNYANACFRYSQTRRGEFATLFNGELIRRWSTDVIPPLEAELRTYETYLRNNNANTANGNNGNGVGLEAKQELQLKPPSDSLFVVSVNDTKTKYERVVSFDYASDPQSRFGIEFVCMRQSGSLYRMSVVEANTALDLSSFNDISYSGPKGTFTQFVKDAIAEKILDKNQQQAKAQTQQQENNHNHNHHQEQQQAESQQHKQDDNQKGNSKRRPSGALSIESAASGTIVDSDTSSDSMSSVVHHHHHHHHRSRSKQDERMAKKHGDDEVEGMFHIDEILENDISSTIRRRAMIGYGPDTGNNVSIFEEELNKDVYLRNTWKWMDIARMSSMSNAMVSNNIDFGFEGVLGIWNGVETFENQTRSSVQITEKRFEKAVKDMVLSRSAERRGQQAIGFDAITRDSKKAAQRQFCLYIAGWDFTKEELDQKLELLISRGQHAKAAGWAVFQGDVPRAVQILARSNRERLRIMSTAIAGYMAYKDIQQNSPWREQCRKMASELDDPYLRAIFAFIADNDWWDVFDESSLPLREKIGVALRFLPDKDLSVFLNRLTEKVVSGGELEGLILTGITPRGMDLLQTYVDKTSDVQTASLLGSVGCPRFFKDERVDTWIDCYRNLLNSWSLFNVRAKFDIARTKLSKTYDDETTLKPAPRQVYLQCLRCNKNISKPKKQDLVNNNKRFNNNAAAQFFKSKRMGGNVSKFPTDCCPHCGASLPRCAICLLSLGSQLPDDMSGEYVKERHAAAAAMDSSKQTMENQIPSQQQAAQQAQDALFKVTSSMIMMEDFQKIDKAFREWFSFCLGCNHGMHAGHAEEWFSKHFVCPVPDCNCRCNNR